MRRNTLSIALALCGLAVSGTTLSGCNGGSHHDSTTSFTEFVNGTAGTTSDTAVPVQINGTTFTFSEDPHAFDGLFH
jgi:hypothetical protein